MKKFYDLKAIILEGAAKTERSVYTYCCATAQLSESSSGRVSIVNQNRSTDNFLANEEGATALSRLALRAVLAANRETPPEILANLASDLVRQVRLSVATNPSTPSEVLEQLSTDGELPAGVRVPELNVPLDILVALMQNRNPYIRKQAELTWQGQEFEEMLKDGGQLLVAGDHYRLGEILLAAQLIKQIEIDNSLRHCHFYLIPLGRTLLQTTKITPTILLAALKLQALIRQEKISAADGIEQLVDLNNEEILANSIGGR